MPIWEDDEPVDYSYLQNIKPDPKPSDYSYFKDMLHDPKPVSNTEAIVEQSRVSKVHDKRRARRLEKRRWSALEGKWVRVGMTWRFIKQGEG